MPSGSRPVVERQLGLEVELIDRGGARLIVPPQLDDPGEVCRIAGTDAHGGLSAIEADVRLKQFGPNELASPRTENRVQRFARQLLEPMSLLLMAAAAVSGLALGEAIDAIAIGAIVVLNASIAYIQEGKAAKAMEALREYEAPHASAVRDAQVERIPARRLVLGDVIVLRPGDRVPADARLVESASLEVDESLLTGESLPVHKAAFAAEPATAGVADRPAHVFDGTLVTRGSARAVVVATGMGSEIGAIAGHLGASPRSTPLQRDLKFLALRLGVLTVLISGLVATLFVLGSGATADVIERAFLVGVALAVAAVPEGLAATTTVALALGVKHMAERGGIVRRLPAVEGLGSVTVLAIDKTGTLTENRMRVRLAQLADGETLDTRAEGPAARAFDTVAVLCNEAALAPPSGDPIDVALLEAVGVERAAALQRAHVRIGLVPFDAERQRMTALHRTGARFVLTVKGAPEAVLQRCAYTMSRSGQVAALDDSRTVLERTAAMASSGLRVLALAVKQLDVATDIEEAERELVFVALVALNDPVRAEAAEAVRAVRNAGVHLVMVTGDHPGTAAAVAAEVGLADDSPRTITGAELREHGAPEDPAAVAVYARVDPAQKLALVERMQELGHVVAVTGDGVNDAPALRRADIGVALGRSGTDVAREAADLVITDDDLSTIVAAMRAGRAIYSNIRKVVDYLLTCNLSEVITFVVALLLFPNVGIPLLPLQLLWMNLVTDGLPALALGVDPADESAMDRPPRPRGQRLLDARVILSLTMRALVMASAAVGSLAVARFVLDEPWPHARVMMFNVLVLAQLLYGFAARQMRDDGRSLSPVMLVRSIGTNPALTKAVVLGAGLQVMALTLPFARGVLDTHPLTPAEWLLGAIMAVASVLVVAALPSIRTPASRPSEARA